MHPVEVLHGDQLLLKVVVEKLIVGPERKYLLLLELPLNKLVHLLLREFPLLEQLLDLGHRVGGADIVLVLNDIKARFKDALHFVRLPDLHLLSCFLFLHLRDLRSRLLV